MQPSAAIKDGVSLVLPRWCPLCCPGHGASELPKAPSQGYNEPFPHRRQVLCQSQAGSLGRASLLLTSSHSPAQVAQRGVKTPQSLSSTQVPQRAYRIFATPLLCQLEAEPRGAVPRSHFFQMFWLKRGQMGAAIALP